MSTQQRGRHRRAAAAPQQPPKLDLMPDLVLIEIFDHLSLVDLFRNIPLVCRNWTRLQPSALARRTRLYLVPSAGGLRPSSPWVRALEPGIIGNGTSEPVINPKDPADQYDREWQLMPWSSNNKNTQLTTTVTLDTIPLVSHNLALLKKTDHLAPLSSPETVDQLARTMPNITELTVVAHDEQVLGAHASARLVRTITRLVTQLGPRLTVLRLHLHRHCHFVGQFGGHQLVDKAIGELGAVINSQLPRLHTLQLNLNWLNSSGKDGSQIVLSPSLLCRLRVLVLNSAGNSLANDVSLEGLRDCGLEHEQPEHQLRPDLSIIYGRAVFDPLLLKDHVAPHVRSLTLSGFPERLPVANWTEFFARLSGLTALRVSKLENRGGHFRLVSLEQLLTSLEPLRHRLAVLYLTDLPPSDRTEHSTPSLLLPVFPWVHTLTVGNLKPGPAFRTLGQCLPHLRQLRITYLGRDWLRSYNTGESGYNANHRPIRDLALHCFKALFELQSVTHGIDHFSRSSFDL